MLIKIAMLAAFFIVTVLVGLIYSKQNLSADDFVLGGRNVGSWLSALSYGTSYFSATVFVGYAGQFGWAFGTSALWIGIGNALIGSLLAWVIFGRRTRVMTRSMAASTMPEFFEKRYGSRVFKLLSAVVIFIFLIPYTASVYKGLSGLFAACFGIDMIWCILGMAVLTSIYVIAGGYMGTAVNNFIQGMIMLVGIILIVTGVLNVNGGLASSIELLSQQTCETRPGLHGAFTSMFGPDPLNLLSVVILTSVGTWGLPHMIHKFYAIRDEKAIKKGTVISTVFAMIIAGGCYFIGGFGRLFYSADKIVFDDIIPTMVTTAMPDALIGLVLLVVLSASISSLASLVITSASTFITDFCKTINPDFFKGKRELNLIRLMCAAFIIISVVIALIPNSLITSLMGLSWGALAGAFLGPFLYGLFWKRTTIASIWASMILGLGIVCSNAILHFTTPTVAGAAAMAASLVIVPLVSIITPKPDKDKVDEIFSCYDVTVSVPQSVAIVNGSAPMKTPYSADF